MSLIIFNRELQGVKFNNETIFKIKHHDLFFVFGYIFAAIETERDNTQTHTEESLHWKIGKIYLIFSLLDI